MLEILHQCAQNLGPSPRKFKFWERFSYLTLDPPIWLLLDNSDELNTVFKYQKELLKNGVLVWGHLIQANTLLFSEGKDNCPGEVVYSLTPSLLATPEYLSEIAFTLSLLKGTNPTEPDLKYIAHYLTDQFIRVFGLDVPDRLSPQLKCKISTVFFDRKHLPNRIISSSILPLVVNPQEPHVAMLLPEKYWPEELLKLWKDGAPN